MGKTSALNPPSHPALTDLTSRLSPTREIHEHGLQQADPGKDCRRKGGCAGPGSKVDAPQLSSGPGWEIQEVSRVGVQGVTSKSKLLAREMPRVCSRSRYYGTEPPGASGLAISAVLQVRS